MQRIGIYYYSKHGQTEKIATRLGDRFREIGWEPILMNLRRSSVRAQCPADFNAALIGAPIYARRYPGPVRRFIEDHRVHLGKMEKTGFFSVCLAVSSGAPESQAEALDVIRPFLDRVSWTPQWLGNFAGALNYREYNLFIRTMMKWISAQNGGPTDTSRDYEMTDWDEVDEFVRAFAGMASGQKFRTDLIPLAARRLNELMPEFEHRLRVRVPVRANWSEIRQAIENLEARDMLLAEILGRIRTLGKVPEERRRFLEEARNFGMVPLLDDAHQEMIGGLIGQFWLKDFGIAKVSNAEDFRKFDKPDYAKVLTNFRLDRDSQGRRWLSSETRIHALSPAARIKFAWYWRLLGSGIRLYMRSILNGVRTRAEALPREERRAA